MSLSIWQQPEIIRWSQILSVSFRQLLGKEIIDRISTPEQLAKELFHAPVAIVSHGIEADPIFNYGNQTALNLWSMDWDKFTKTPSRLTVKPESRDARAKMLEQAAKQGYIDNYHGIRISSTGQRFSIKKVIIWNLTNESGQRCGQAATFAHWKWL